MLGKGTLLVNSESVDTVLVSTGQALAYHGV